MDHREFKDPLYAQFARVGHAVASPKRIELLDLLAQGPKTVEILAEQAATPVKNTSAHLRVLRQARLVETERKGTHVHYRLADDAVFQFLDALQSIAHRRLAEVEQVASLYFTRPNALQPVSAKELRRLLRDGNITLLDVRPRSEFLAAHIPGALSVPVAELKRRLGEIPKRKEVIAYCRGPYCIYSVEAVEILRKHGYRARRSEQGVPHWRAEGFAVAKADT
jgi:rhodanese-related sulfurtransferase